MAVPWRACAAIEKFVRGVCDGVIADGCHVTKLLSLEAILRELSSPAMYPQNLDPARGRVLTIHMREADYRAASFLDDRVLTRESEGAWVPYPRLAEAVARMEGDARPLHFIFHIGHAGSTLLSRLLDELGGVLPLREPLPLRTLAEAPDAERLKTFARLWRRGLRPY